MNGNIFRRIFPAVVHNCVLVIDDMQEAVGNPDQNLNPEEPPGKEALLFSWLYGCWMSYSPVFTRFCSSAALAFLR
jgi:hypothetical protein